MNIKFLITSIFILLYVLKDRFTCTISGTAKYTVDNE
jgi:hypothetical protein